MAKEKFHYYFLWLSLTCIGAFALQSIIPGFTDSLILNKDAINKFQIWRFLTSIFLHASITHLLFNLFALIIFGVLLEKIIGGRNFLIVSSFQGLLQILSVLIFMIQASELQEE